MVCFQNSKEMVQNNNADLKGREDAEAILLKKNVLKVHLNVLENV